MVVHSGRLRKSLGRDGCTNGFDVNYITDFSTMIAGIRSRPFTVRYVLALAI